jgi:hypothetical protein
MTNLDKKKLLSRHFPCPPLPFPYITITVSTLEQNKAVCKEYDHRWGEYAKQRHHRNESSVFVPL